MDRVNNRRFLGFLGFLGFLIFLDFPLFELPGSLESLPFLSFLSLGSFLVFLPRERGKVRHPVAPDKKKYLVFLVFLIFLGALAGPAPALARFSFPAFAALLAVGPEK